VLLSSGDNFPHLIQKRRSQLGFVTYILNYPRINNKFSHEWSRKYIGYKPHPRNATLMSVQSNIFINE